MKTRTFYSMCIVLILLTLITAPAIAMAPGATDPPPVVSPLVQMFIEVAGLSAFLFAAVAWLKQWGVEGKNLTLASLGSGMVIGFLVRYATSPPATIAEWIWAFLYGLLCGFVASGAYKGGQSMVGADDKSLAKAKQAESAQTAKVAEAIKGPVYEIKQRPS